MWFDGWWPFWILPTVPGGAFAGSRPVLVRKQAPDPILSLGEARLHLKLDPLPVNMETGALLPDAEIAPNPDDSLVRAMVAAVQGELDGWNGWLGRAVAPQVWQMGFGAFPGSLILPLPPLIAVQAVEYLAADGATWLEVPPATYRSAPGDVINPHGVLVLAPGAAWPALPAYDPAQSYPVRVTFQAGYADPLDPELGLIKAYARLRLGMLYENREAEIVGTITGPLTGWRDMLENLRVNHPWFLRGAA
jgi:hypothetical protein